MVYDKKGFCEIIVVSWYMRRFVLGSEQVIATGINGDTYEDLFLRTQYTSFRMIFGIRSSPGFPNGKISNGQGLKGYSMS